MCIPASEALVNTFTTLANAYKGAQRVSGLIQENKNAKYSAQIALSKAKSAQMSALNEAQKGINESRKEKLTGLRQAGALLAKNSGSGFSANEGTLNQNIEDIKDNAYNSAQTIEDEYKQNAYDYIQKANSYILEANNEINNYNNKLLNTALGALGSTMNVAADWGRNEIRKRQDEKKGGGLL